MEVKYIRTVYVRELAGIQLIVVEVERANGSLSYENIVGESVTYCEFQTATEALLDAYVSAMNEALRFPPTGTAVLS